MNGNTEHLKGTKHPRGFGLKQIEYRSFIKSIPIFHFEHSHHSIAEFEVSMFGGNSDFVCRLESTDPFINDDGSEKISVANGDEVPDGFTEVAYLRNVFRDPLFDNSRSQGSALGFRLLDENRIEWFCFVDAIDDVLKVQTDHGPLFDLVGYIDRGEPNVNYKGKVGGYPEHRLWYESLQDAQVPFLTLTTVETNRKRPLRGLTLNDNGLGVETEKQKDDATTDVDGPNTNEDEHMEDASGVDGPEASLTNGQNNAQQGSSEGEDSEESEEE